MQIRKLSKRGGVGDVLSLFFATTVIVILLFIALFGSSIVKLITLQKTSSESIIPFMVLPLEIYMEDFELEISGFNSEGLVSSGVDSFILTRYFPNYVFDFGDEGVEGNAFDESFVRDSCFDYKKHRLTFITGVTDVAVDYTFKELDLFYEQEAQDSCFFVLRYLQDESPGDSFFTSITEFNIDVIDREVGVLCCYGD